MILTIGILTSVPGHPSVGAAARWNFLWGELGDMLKGKGINVTLLGTITYQHIQGPSRHFGLEAFLNKMIFRFPVQGGICLIVPVGVENFSFSSSQISSEIYHVDDGQVFVFIDGLPPITGKERPIFHSDLFAKKKNTWLFRYTRDYTTELSGDKKNQPP